MEQKLKELKLEVKSLLEEYPAGINVNSFWNCYQRKYGKLPEPKVFKVQKRSTILELCSDIYRRVGSGAAAVIHLKPSDYSQQQRCLSAVGEGAVGAKGTVGAKESEQARSQTFKPQTSAETVTPKQAGMNQNQFSGGGSFYQRFYAQSDADSNSVAAAHTGTHSVSNPASRGSYSTLMGTQSRPNAAVGGAQSTAPATYPLMQAQRFAIPSLPSFSRTPLASSSAVSQHYQTPRSRDSSASRSSDSGRNPSPAPGVRHTGPRHQAPGAPTSLFATPMLTAGRGVTAGRGRRTNYSREQLNSAAEDCIDRLSVAKDYVSLDKISRLLCHDFEVASLDELGVRQIDDLPCVNEHKRLECKVNAYIQNFVKVCWFRFSVLISCVLYRNFFWTL